jgi:hypothetical protein
VGFKAMGVAMENPSFGASREGGHSKDDARSAGRHRPTPLHVVGSRDSAPGRYPYRPTLDSQHRRSPQARANRRAWWMCWVIGPALIALAGVAIVVSQWR